MRDSPDNQSLSAPSSPTHAPQPPPRNTSNVTCKETSKQSRPQSMAVSLTDVPPFSSSSSSSSNISSSTTSSSSSNTNSKYADLRFHNDTFYPVPKPRKNLNYAEVTPSRNTTTCNQQKEVSNDPPTTQTMVDIDNPSYDVPPPPVPIRTNEDLISHSVTTTNTQHSLPQEFPPLPPKELPIRDPFAPLPPPVSDPFQQGGVQVPSYSNSGEFELNFPLIPPGDDLTLWELDNKLYANTPTSRLNTDSGYIQPDSQALYANDVISELGTFPDFGDSVDVTGSSTYEDSALVRAAILRNQKVHVDDGYCGIPILPKIKNDNMFDSDFDKQENEITLIDDSSPPNISSYEFPSELAKHPMRNLTPEPQNHQRQVSEPVDLNSMERNTKPGLYEDPPMELLNFVAKKKQKDVSPPLPPPPSYNTLFTQDLPPLPHKTPLDRSRSVDPVPRPRNHTTPIHVPPLPPPNPSKGNDPPLPIRNPQPTPRTNGQTQEPPLPPRNPTRRSASPVPPSIQLCSTPPTSRSHNRENVIQELVQSGYTRSEVVKALAVSQNNTDLALKILESFGSRGQ